MSDTTPSHKPAKSMAELMATHTNTFQSYKKGDTVKGIITKLTRNEIILDINAKTDAIVMEKDRKIQQMLLSELKEGQEVTATIIVTEAENGHPVVSLRRFIDEISWQKLQGYEKNQEALTVTIRDITKGGYIAEMENGATGFLPNSHTSLGQNPQNAIGQQVKVYLLELNRKENKIILSQKKLVNEKDFADAVKNIKSGQKVTAKVVNITPFGIFTSLETDVKGADGENVALDALIHISEVAWEKTTDLSGQFTTGQTIDAYVIGIDKDGRRIDLSVKRLTADPFEEIAKKFAVDTRVSGTVSRIEDAGIYIDLEEGVEGLIKKDKVPPTMQFEEGKTVSVTVSDIDARRHRILLTPVLLEKPIGYR